MPLSDPFGALYPQMDGAEAFDRYEHVRGRLPQAEYPDAPRRAASLLEIADRIDIFVFDAYGVLNTGPTPIPGASNCVARLRAMGKQLFVLTNAASFPASNNVAKFARLGFDFIDQEIVSSRAAAEQAMAAFNPDMVWGVAAAPSYSPDDFQIKTCKLGDDSTNYDDVSGFFLASTMDWNAGRQKILETSLRQNPRPVIVANPDIVAPVGGQFSTEPGYFGHRLVEKFGSDVHFHGKPFPSVYDIIEARMGTKSAKVRVAMVGDTLHTDVLGGAARGWSTVLVTGHGLFKGLDPELYIKRSGIVPHWTVESI